MHLERAALQLDDVRLRPAVVHNFLLLLHQLHGHHGEPPATFAQVAELLARVSPEERGTQAVQLGSLNSALSRHVVASELASGYVTKVFC